VVKSPITALEVTLNSLDGIISAKVNTKTNVLVVHYRTEIVILRKLIKDVQDLGYPEAEYIQDTSKNDIRDVM